MAKLNHMYFRGGNPNNRPRVKRGRVELSWKRNIKRLDGGLGRGPL